MKVWEKIREIRKEKTPPISPEVPLGKKERGTLLMELFMEALRAGNDTMVTLASELLVRCGPQAVPDLVREAADSRSSPHFRERLLGIVERIGAPDVDSYFDLFFLTRRAAAVRGLKSLRGGDVGTSRGGD